MFQTSKLRRRKRNVKSRLSNVIHQFLKIWVAFCRVGTVSLTFVTSKMKSRDYVQVLNEHLLPFVEARRDQPLVFQHDNASIHVSAETSRFLQDKNICVLDWPACSPDLNPIENVWGNMVRQVYVENKQYALIAQLKAAILDVWRKLDLQTLKNHVDSMPNCMLEIVQSKGNAINY